jgi:ATP-dependent exoDNAse (exonuclease V) beta subunit
MFEVFEELDKFNLISFEEESHRYLYNGKECISTTSVINKYKKHFNVEEQATRYSLKHGLEYNDVVKEWDDKRIASIIKGTHAHKYAELKFANKVYSPSEEDLPVSLRLMIDKFYDDSRGRLIPIRSEMIVGDEDLLLCGMIDQLFYNVKANELQIWDYKTNKEINTYSKYKNKMTNGLNHLQECEYNTYSLQLGIYKKIIEKNTNLKLGNSYICWINEQNDTYKTFKMADMVNEVDFIFNNLAA